MARDLSTDPRGDKDNSAHLADAVPLNGISSFAPGETVVCIGGNTPADFNTAWGTSGLSIGEFKGPGLVPAPGAPAVLDHGGPGLTHRHCAK